MNIPKDKIEQWCNELYSGEWKQGKFKLQSGDSFCCFGVGCKVFIPESELTLKNDVLFGYIPEDQDNAPEWLREIAGDLWQKEEICLAHLNDDGIEFEGKDQTLTFEEIADVLMAVYVLEIDFTGGGE